MVFLMIRRREQYGVRGNSAFSHLASNFFATYYIKYSVPSQNCVELFAHSYDDVLCTLSLTRRRANFIPFSEQTGRKAQKSSTGLMISCAFLPVCSEGQGISESPRTHCGYS